MMEGTRVAGECCICNVSVSQALPRMMPAHRAVGKVATQPVDTVVDRTIFVMSAWERHAPELLGFLTRAVRDRAAAEDLLQEAFVRLVRETRAGRRPSDVRAWLFRVAANLVVSAGRRRATVARWAPFLVRRSEAEPSTEHRALARELSAQLHAALGSLSPDGRTAVLLAAHGLDTASIAAAIGRTELATRSLLCRSRLRIRQQLHEKDVYS